MNKNITTREIRDIFLRFFEGKNHLLIPGASLIPVNDPTLLFINAGMAPLKKYFIGEEVPPQPDLCDVQPCIRTIDIEEVGDRFHLSFFEMLGSWSFNNYFKQRAIELAYELLVEHFGFPKDRLYVTVYQGNPVENIPPDEESARAWEAVGQPKDHIVFLGEDNFWGPAGETGPCGPCTEVFFDTGDEYGQAYGEGGPFDTNRYIEIWNAGVFMEFNKQADGSLTRLKFNSVDTGSGLERMAFIMNGSESIYDIDTLQPLLQQVQDQLAGVSAATIADTSAVGTINRPLQDVGNVAGTINRPIQALVTTRILTDHIRAATFILSEGVVPSNEGRGYIPRRLIRKCLALTARAEKPRFDFESIIASVIREYGDLYPKLQENQREIVDAFSQERKDFERVIGKGMKRLKQLSENPPFTISGHDAFILFSTYGMPLTLIRDFAHASGGTVDEEGYLREYRQHQEVSRNAARNRP
jgi:alanyl-tRNA synthetase